MNYQPQFQPSPYMQQAQRPQGLLGNSIGQAQPLDQGLLAPPAMAAPISYANEPDPARMPGEPARFLDPLRNAAGTAAQPVRQAVQPLQQAQQFAQQFAQQNANQFQQAAQDQFRSMMPQQSQQFPISPEASGQGGNPKQQMLMQMLKSMFMGG
jgi:hypothetical protein